MAAETVDIVEEAPNTAAVKFLLERGAGLKLVLPHPKVDKTGFLNIVGLYLYSANCGTWEPRFEQWRQELLAHVTAAWYRRP